MPRRSSPLALVPATFCIAILAGADGCRSVTTQMPINLESAVATHGDPVRAWEVRDAGVVAGTLVKYFDADHPARGFFSVRNPEQQVLGIIDLDGRAWRYRPHVKDAEWLGTGTVAQGASWILGCSDACEIVEIPLADLAHAAATSTQ
jgi:hypothetical protein